MAKKKNDYFEMLTRQAQYCVKASELLEKMLCDFSSRATPALREQMHNIEHEADELHHTICTNLAAEFITPIDQEDILRLVQIIDDVTDALDEVVLEFYMYDLNVLPKGADHFSKLVNRCVKALFNSIAELKNFKKPNRLNDLLAEVNAIETEADGVYNEAMHELFVSSSEAKILISNKAVYESLENCCDLCEHAADEIEQIVVKNT